MTSIPTSNGPVLRDIQVPQVSWWPPAPGWWLLALVILVSIVAIAAVVPRYRRRRRPLLAARRELDALAAQHACDRDDAALAAGVSRLLRRVALTIDPVAAANEGAAWRVFVDRCAPGVFTHEQLEMLSDAPFRARVSFDVEATMDAARKWCERALRIRGKRRYAGALRRNRVAVPTS